MAEEKVAHALAPPFAPPLALLSFFKSFTFLFLNGFIVNVSSCTIYRWKAEKILFILCPYDECRGRSPSGRKLTIKLEVEN